MYPAGIFYYAEIIPLVGELFIDKKFPVVIYIFPSELYNEHYVIGQLFSSLFEKKNDHPFELITYSAELLLNGNVFWIGGV